MNKFEKVLSFVVTNKVFTRKQFERRFGQYSNTESTYLTALVSAKIVSNPFPGAFARSVPKAKLKGLRVSDVLEKAYG